MNRITLAVALTVATFSTGALAQSSDEQQACMSDAFRVCSATIPDRTKTIACMVQNKAQLSAACQTVMNKYAPGGNATQVAVTAPARTVTRNASMKPVVSKPVKTTAAPAKPIKTAASAQRPGKPLNIQMR